MLGLFNQGPYFAYKNHLSNLLVVNKSCDKPGWDDCYRYVVPSSARELPAGSHGCIAEWWIKSDWGKGHEQPSQSTALPFPVPRGGAVKCQMGLSSARAPHLGSHLLSKQLMPHPVRSALYVQWQRHGGRLWYAWPQKTCHRHATRLLHLSWHLLESKPTSGISLFLQLSS